MNEVLTEALGGEDKLRKPEAAIGAYWPSIYDVAIRVKGNKDRYFKSNWRLIEPENVQVDFIAVEKVVSNSKQAYVIWRKQPDCTIVPCDSSLSENATMPSVHILQTEDENGNTVFKEMIAEKINYYLEHVPVYTISGSWSELDTNSFCPFPAEEKFYSWRLSGTLLCNYSKKA